MSIVELYQGSHNDTAISAPSRTGITHGELRSQTHALGRQLRAADIGPDDRVALVLPNGPAMAAAFAGFSPWCATAPLNPAYKADEFDFYLADLAARALVVEHGSTSPALDVAASRGVRILHLEEGEAAGFVHLAGVGEAPVESRGGDDIALILHTSGTTSRPKMVPLSQANLAASARNIAGTLRLVAADRCLNIMPLFHIHGLMAPVLASLSGGCRGGVHARVRCAAVLLLARGDRAHVVQRSADHASGHPGPRAAQPGCRPGKPLALHPLVVRVPADDGGWPNSSRPSMRRWSRHTR